MKKIFLLLHAITLLSCSNESNFRNETIEEINENMVDNNKLLNPPLTQCSFGYTIDDYHQHEPPPGYTCVIEWDFSNAILPFDPVGIIEIRPDNSSNCWSAYGNSMVQTHNIDIINENTLSFSLVDSPTGYSPPACFEYRIVVTGKVYSNGRLVRCRTESPWKYFVFHAP